MNPQYKLAVLKEHLFNDRFNYRTDSAVRIFPKGSGKASFKLLGYGSYMVLEKSRKIIVLDSDGVVNKVGTDSPTLIFAEYLIENNPVLRRKAREVKFNMMMLEKDDNPTQYADNLNRIFKESELTKDLYDSACEYAASKFSIAHNLPLAMERMGKMGYTVSILTASPYEVVENYSKRIPIEMENVQASDFHFRHGVFEEMHLNLGDSRSRKKERLMDRQIKNGYQVEIIVDDNSVTGRKMLKGGWDSVGIFPSDVKVESPGVSINIPEIRHDFLVLVDRLRRLERGIVVVLTMSEGDYKWAIKAAHEAVYCGNRASEMRGYEFDNMKGNFIENIKDYMDIMGFRFPSRATGLYSRVRSLELESNEFLSKSKLRDLVSIFHESSIESQMPLELAAK